MSQFRIGNRILQHSSPSYFIADIAANHDGDINRAIELIHLAKEAGADCAKFQHFEADKIVSDEGFRGLQDVRTHQSDWVGSVSEVYDKYHTRKEWTDQIIRECENVDIDFMTTPYDIDAVLEFTDKMKAFKVGSGDITYAPILREIAKTKKSVFFATGASDIDEVHQAMSIFDESPVCIMQCNTNYTGDLENFKYVNLNVLKLFATKYPNRILGLSDHTPGHAAVLGAVTLGAVAIEKHFTDDNARVGPDHKFALNPVSWREMVERTRELELALGDGVKRIENNEKNTAIVQRRAIRAKVEIPAGAIIEEKDIECLRPCEPGDVNPMHLNEVLGRRVEKKICKGKALTWSNLHD